MFFHDFSTSFRIRREPAGLRRHLRDPGLPTTPPRRLAIGGDCGETLGGATGQDLLGDFEPKKLDIYGYS